MVPWCMDCSPYFTVTGTHLLFPLGITEATYLFLPPDAPLLTTDLIVNQAITLQKHCLHLMALTSEVYATWIKATVGFKWEHTVIIMDFNFKLGDLILIRNTTIENYWTERCMQDALAPSLWFWATRVVHTLYQSSMVLICHCLPCHTILHMPTHQHTFYQWTGWHFITPALQVRGYNFHWPWQRQWWSYNYQRLPPWPTWWQQRLRTIYILVGWGDMSQKHFYIFAFFH